VQGDWPPDLTHFISVDHEGQTLGSMVLEVGIPVSFPLPVSPPWAWRNAGSQTVSMQDPLRSKAVGLVFLAYFQLPVFSSSTSMRTDLAQYL
jgi:hypothetical protein